MGWRRFLLPLVTAASCAAALALTGMLAFDWHVARSLDAESLSGFVGLSARSRVLDLAHSIAAFATLPVYVVGGAMLASIAIARRRLRLAVGVPVTLLAAIATTEALKHLSSHPRYSPLLGPDQLPPASWPSGHVTATMTLALCAIVVVPSAWRPLVAALGASAAVVVSYTMLVLAWHFPSDVLGGLLVAGAWTWLMLAVVEWGERGVVRHVASCAAVPQWATPAALAALGVSATLLAQLLESDHASLDFTMIATAAVIAALVAALAGGLLVTLAASSPRPVVAPHGSVPNSR